jgi:alpha/beta superfamily hydrolase
MLKIIDFLKKDECSEGKMMATGIAQKIQFPSGSLSLEGILVKGKLSKAVVVSHPHPLYGGDMHNHVVGLIAGAFEDRGWTTLCFNFRGVGRSQGDFDQGLGEQEDVADAVAYLKGLGETKIILAGYSFGAGVNARAALSLPDVQGSILVSPPAGMMDFSFMSQDTKTRLIIVGDQDPYAPVAQIKSLVQSLPAPPPIKIIKGADHFYSSGWQELTAAITEIEPSL